tara:strand:- start:424 stop:1641 length:1218 start_codon:yes stop_codon:yes gene_type:complete
MASACNVCCAVRALLRHARRVPSTPSTRVLSSARASAAAAAGFNGFTRASATVATHRGRPVQTTHRGRPVQTRLASTLNPEGTIDANLGGGSVDQVRITRVDGSNVGELQDVLLSLGATCCSVEDADLGTERETELYAGDDEVWHSCDVTAMFASGVDIDAVMADAVDILGVKAIEYVVETIPDNDWVNVVMDSFVPIKVSDGLWIVPEWAKTLPAGEEDGMSVVLEPGLAFGTGEHPTTRLCLGWLRDNAEVCVRDKHVVDFGTGSGVLAIGALLMGAAKATGVDVDPLSVKSARRNARLNGVDDSRLALFCADGSDDDDLPADCDGTVDCVVANILVGPVTQLAPLFARYAKKGSGRVCVSGVLATQVPTVRDAYGEWFDDLSHEEEGGWAVVSGVRNSTPAP